MRTERFSGIGSDGQPYIVFMRKKTGELDRPRRRKPAARWLRAHYYLDNGDELTPTDDCTVFRTKDGDVLITLLAI